MLGDNFEKEFIFGSNGVTMDIIFCFLDKERRPHIISNSDCFIFKRLILRLDDLNMILFFFLSRLPFQVFNLVECFFLFCFFLPFFSMDSGITLLAQARKLLVRPIYPCVKVYFVTEGSDNVCWERSFVLEK